MSIVIALGMAALLQGDPQDQKATQKEPAAQQEEKKAPCDEKDKDKAQQPPAKKPVAKRRAVQQDILTMPRPTPPLGSNYPKDRVPAINPGPTPTVPTAPMPATCIGGTCSTPNGQQMNGVGNTLIDQNGRTCVRNGAFVQCN